MIDEANVQIEVYLENIYSYTEAEKDDLLSEDAVSPISSGRSVPQIESTCDATVLLVGE